jgi:hypothetical protein
MSDISSQDNYLGFSDLLPPDSFGVMLCYRAVTCALKYIHLIFLENSMRNKEIPEPLSFSIKTTNSRCWSAVVTEEKDDYPKRYG